MSKNLIDLHTHTKRCRHATGEVSEYIEFAISKNITTLGFSDHFPMFYLPETIDTSTYCMQMEEVQDYISEIEIIREKHSEIDIKIASEIDFIIGKEGEIKNAIKKYPFDYLLGAVHVIDDWCFDDPNNLSKYDQIDIIDIYTTYYMTLKKAIDSRLFDVMAHLDLVKKFGFRPKQDISNLIDPIIDSLKNNKVCIELNTAGSRKPVKEFYPDRKILRKCYENDIPLTLGSDAHKPEEVAWKFEDAIALIKEIGYNQLVKFSGRKKEYTDI
jgi:histidinol-phosphatase (PHP family)